MTTPHDPPNGPGRNDAYLFLALACAITWVLDFPLVYAWATDAAAPPYAMPMVGLGAWGPTLAAFLIASRRRQLRGVFGRWRTSPVWIIAGLLLPLAVQLPATLIEVLLGGHPAHWFYPPDGPERFAALVMFPLGEEFGWRGFAYPRLEERHGPVVGSLILGSVWGLWHLGMMIAPDLERARETGDLALQALPSETIFIFIVQMALWSIVMAWMFERSNRSIAVAIAMHAGAHIDNVSRAPYTELRLRILRFAVLAVVAALAARSLMAKKRSSPEAVALAS
jgi:membrane protease YdiL (CAAX protease family)